ncbi:HAMP domain-containing protein [Streptomyces indicus]|uniref:HAMP domain-containing protein n=1 Tax=Streptomyces indicus TaxID=417292 RepID=A0A1G9I0K0_9ACTN|nr:HAMP domain-containing protein [Streptomyces indicus]SDL18576.1 HAMP domain-containing protein [Streptomyces indicus]
MAQTPERRRVLGRRADVPLLGGARPPLVLLSALLLGVCVFTAVTVGRADDTPVSQAVLDAQQFIAEDGAGTVGSALRQQVRDLPHATRMFGALPPREMVAAISGSYQKWRGLALRDPATGRTLAATGEAIPATGPLPATPSAALARLPDGQTRLVTHATFQPPGKRPLLLLASGALRMPPDAAGRTTLVTDPAGQVLAAAGERASDPALRASAGARRTPVVTDGPDRQLALGSAPVAGDETVEGFGLTLTTAVSVPRGTAARGDARLALAAAAALLAITALTTWLLRRRVQQPLLRLGEESGRLARGETSQAVRVRGWGEPLRIGEALESLRAELRSGEPILPRAAAAPACKGLGSVRATALLCTALVAGWALTLPLLNHADAQDRVREQAARTLLGRDQGYRTQATADRLRRLVLEAAADLSSLAPAVRRDAAQASALLEQAAADGQRWRALYLLDPTGAVLATAGDSPTAYDWRPLLASLAEPTTVQLNHSGKEPLVAALAPLGNGAMLVGELEPELLSAPLDHPGIGRAWLVDARSKVIGGNRGFTAFASLPGQGVVGTLTEWSTDSSLGDLLRGADAPAFTADAPLTGPGPVARLGWRVVTEKPLSWSALPSYETERRCVVAGLLALAAVLLCMGWLHLVVLRPLREAARAAVALAGGDRRTVLYPRHADEVGTIMRNLDLIRRRLAAEQPVDRSGHDLSRQEDG